MLIVTWRRGVHAGLVVTLMMRLNRIVFVICDLNLIIISNGCLSAAWSIMLIVGWRPTSYSVGLLC